MFNNHEPNIIARANNGDLSAIKTLLNKYLESDINQACSYALDAIEMITKPLKMTNSKGQDVIDPKRLNNEEKELLVLSYNVLAESNLYGKGGISKDLENAKMFYQMAIKLAPDNSQSANGLRLIESLERQQSRQTGYVWR
jgi:N-acetylglutamate synthase-like GNAT family acetyltransferase